VEKADAEHPSAQVQRHAIIFEDIEKPGALGAIAPRAKQFSKMLKTALNRPGTAHAAACVAAMMITTRKPPTRLEVWAVFWLRVFAYKRLS